jgi:hypothetical protein
VRSGLRSDKLKRLCGWLKSDTGSLRAQDQVDGRAVLEHPDVNAGGMSGSVHRLDQIPGSGLRLLLDMTIRHPAKRGRSGRCA